MPKQLINNNVIICSSIKKHLIKFVIFERLLKGLGNPSLFPTKRIKKCCRQSFRQFLKDTIYRPITIIASFSLMLVNFRVVASEIQKPRSRANTKDLKWNRSAVSRTIIIKGGIAHTLSYYIG